MRRPADKGGGTGGMPPRVEAPIPAIHPVP